MGYGRFKQKIPGSYFHAARFARQVAGIGSGRPFTSVIRSRVVIRPFKINIIYFCLWQAISLRRVARERFPSVLKLTQAVNLDQLAVNIQVSGESETRVIPVSIDTPQTITFDSTYHAVEAAQWGDPSDPASLTSVQFASVSSLVYSIPGPGDGVGGVPATSTWAMMLIGFAGLGYAAYRKARASSAA
jgi:hypothetical protein